MGELGGVDRHLLAAVHYTARGLAAPAAAGHITLPLKPLGEPLVEVWQSREPVERGQQQEVVFARNKDVLFGHLCVAEQDYDGFDAAVFEAYRRLYSVAHRQGYPYPLRIWNFLPDITGQQDNLERYQAFCEGRHRALATLTSAPMRLPAATAIGTQGGGLQSYFLAAREPGRQLENPRQVSAFHYPRRYSPKSPSFSRAIVKRWGAATHLYISGTASIVGHESRHASDTLAQLNEILSNLSTLVRHASRLHALGIHSVRELSLLKIYVRITGDRDAIATRVSEVLGAELPVLLLQGDICRRDLHLEIEGLYTGPSERD
jgi:chorismate lyase / 3-hydroxybenzoate synthase